MNKKEKAEFNFIWLTAPGSSVFLAALISIPLLGMTFMQFLKVLRETIDQMTVPILTIMFMLGLSYLTRYAGMDATLGVAFAQTGFMYPFFAAILGWLGVFLTGTDAGSNALFGSLQKSPLLKFILLVSFNIFLCLKLRFLFVPPIALVASWVK